jgi:glycosyltransferase involved in cell wall biosynthesis
VTRTTYGIFLCYAPTIDLRHQGLGRQLAALLKAAAARDDVRFVVACPSWSRESLQALCESEGVPAGSFEVLAPAQVPPALRLYNAAAAWRKKRSARAGLLRRIAQVASSAVQAGRARLEAAVATSRSMAGLSVVLLVAALVALVPALLLALPFALWLSARWLARRLRRNRWVAALRARTAVLMASPKTEPLASRMYRLMQQRESELLVALINRQPSVRAWFSPTAFWPAFNAITAPRLMCVPDVVLAEFPVSFSAVGGDRFLENFNDVEAAIAGAGPLVTYSEHTKWQTLVGHYGVAPSRVRAIPHAPNDLSRWITVSGFPDLEAVQRNRCEYLLRVAMARTSGMAYGQGFANPGMRFIFYASQFRPSKNVMTLLRAYEHLLRKQHMPHKLVLTGDLAVMPQLREFIHAHHLEKDVLCLHGLELPELAACYRLAELAVNPSLSEGGCPFTFCEALSVGTPVVMARIPVTLEVLGDEALQDTMFFDPYQWRDLADRMVWALGHREQLLQAQRVAYGRLAQRTWGDVLEEHVQALDWVAALDGRTGVAGTAIHERTKP